MALHIRRDEQRTRAQDQIASDLRAKAAAASGAAEPEGSALQLEHDAHDSYLENSESSSKLFGVWVTLLVVGVGVVLYLVVAST